MKKCISCDKYIEDYDKFCQYCGDNQIKTPEECFIIGYNYYYGNGVAQDYNKAFLCYEKACNGNNMDGCNNLGYMYENGIGVIEDKVKAFIFYEKASNAGHILACNNLGWLYENGFGVIRNKTKARELYEKACNAGSVDGCNNFKRLNSIKNRWFGWLFD